MSWIDRIFNKCNIVSSHRVSVPDGVWTKCSACGGILYKEELTNRLWVCPQCDYHMPWPARTRLMQFLDNQTHKEIGAELEPKDILQFRDTQKYKDRLLAAQKKTGEKEAIIVIQGTLRNILVVAAAFDFSFIGGSMSSVVGARFVLAVEHALLSACPLICFSASGGARMQEALFSLMQMAKTSSALAKLRAHRLPYISVLTNPTMGGVSASLAMLGDINIAEPKALIGFAGPRVIEQTVRKKLPDGFQRSEFLLQKGGIDMIVHRSHLRDKIASLLAKLMHLSSPHTQ